MNLSLYTLTKDLLKQSSKISAQDVYCGHLERDNIAAVIKQSHNWGSTHKTITMVIIFWQFLIFHQFSFYHKWNEAWLLVINWYIHVASRATEQVKT